MLFKNGDSVVFLGDSNTENGIYIDYLRMSFKTNGLNIAIFNKGIAGYRMDLCLNSLDEELEFINPNYAFINYGGNDIGIWLYEKETVDDDITKEKAFRINRYKKTLDLLVKELLEKNITPILTSPISFNPRFIENNNIESVYDNKEKVKNLDDSLYTKETFNRINRGLSMYRDVVKTYALENGYYFLDIYEYTMNNFDSRMYASDGTHLTLLGHKELARFILSFLGIKLVEKEFPQTLRNLKEKEILERGYYFIKYVIFMDEYQMLSNEEMHKKLKKIIQEKGYVDGITKTRKDGFELYYQDKEKILKKELVKIITD